MLIVLSDSVFNILEYNVMLIVMRDSDNLYNILEKFFEENLFEILECWSSFRNSDIFI